MTHDIFGVVQAQKWVSKEVLLARISIKEESCIGKGSSKSVLVTELVAFNSSLKRHFVATVSSICRTVHLVSIPWNLPVVDCVVCHS